MTGLDIIMKKIKITSSEVETEKDEETDIFVLKAENEVIITKETFDELGKEIKALRNDFIL